MIFHKHKAIFIHIPKAGGTSIERLLWPDEKSRTAEDLWMGFVKPFYNKYQTGGLQHLLAKQIKKEVGIDIFNNYYKFCIVRNPWDKAVSQFSYMTKRKDLREFIGMKEGVQLEQYLNLINKKEHVQWKKQVDFVLDDNGENLSDDVYKLENIDHALNYFSSRFNTSIEKIPHHNKGNRKPYSEYYTAETREIVSEMYKDDIQYFKYQF
jgi:sulfur relay (sulfurtransferase) DsrC/TusE family protein